MDASEEHLWGTAGAGGDADAFGVLFDRHCDAVYRYCLRRTRSWSVAEELTSLTFLEAWRLRGKARLDSGSLRPWLLGVATNVDRNRSRAERRHAAMLAGLGRPEAVPDIADAVAAELDALAAFDSLPRRDRDVAILCLQQGLSYSEAAAALDIPIGTVRSRLSRARTRLAREDLR